MLFKKKKKHLMTKSRNKKLTIHITATVYTLRLPSIRKPLVLLAVEAVENPKSDAFGSIEPNKEDFTWGKDSVLAVSGILQLKHGCRSWTVASLPETARKDHHRQEPILWASGSCLRPSGSPMEVEVIAGLSSNDRTSAITVASVSRLTADRVKSRASTDA